MGQSTLIKGAGGLVVLGGAGTGGYLTYKNYSEKTIEQVLNEGGLTVLTSTEESKWENVINAYKSNTAGNTVTGFVSQVVSQNDKDTIDKFIEKCQKVVIKKFEDDDESNFKNAVRWCVGEVSISKALENLNQTLIEDNETAKWEESIKKMEQNRGTSIDKSTDAISSLRSDCSTKAIERNVNENYWTTWKFVSKYCMKPKS